MKTQSEKWELLPYTKNYIGCDSRKGGQNAKTIAITNEYLGKDAEEGFAIAKANALRIVKAVNMQGELIEEMEALLKVVDDIEFTTDNQLDYVRTVAKKLLVKLKG